MTFQELDNYEQSLKDWLLDNNFVRDYEILVDGYSRSIRKHDKLLICIDVNYFQFVQIKDQFQDKVCIYNSDNNGKLSIEYLDQLIKVIYWKV
jgi:hypothetical protein